MSAGRRAAAEGMSGGAYVPGWADSGDHPAFEAARFGNALAEAGMMPGYVAPERVAEDEGRR
ncbi:hypothetical protein HLH34_15270 [Gluconacetobacter azotocaptans]|uniref:Uncharacterized protein n=2 Tax=Gluconacetobacter azotocaptans TaxID=142834 RepID=A0A7W4JUW7_9PROT|nr:hypothetical protein [Gluconacetobacter azotocaptans]MBB2191303.1 hypothetical protein [Gluconacetobacter azotocaptans]GBQ28696.1 hypothetical protein AA13594_1085 [Gluconacetobacter azotocaptans DSM 13594]